MYKIFQLIYNTINNTTKMNKISRFAPSPTGKLHLGTLYTAFFTYLISDQMILRIEDTDTQRSKAEYTENILFNLQSMNIQYKKIIYQSKNIEKHLEVANILLEKKLAYKAKGENNDAEWIDRQNYFLENLKESYVIRLNTQKIIQEDFVSFTDEVYGDIKYSKKDLDDLIIIRSNHTPTYNLCVVIDDNSENINYIIRGNDHITNTFKQILIYKAMNWPIPKYVHLPLIESMSGGKLSKRKESISVDDFLKQGFLPIAILNLLFLLGSSSKKEILNLKEMKENIDIKKISKPSSKFDIQKMRFINSQHMKNLPQLKESMRFFIKMNNFDMRSLNVLDRTDMITEFLKKCMTLDELYNFTKLYYDESDYLNLNLIKDFNKENIKKYLNLLFTQKEMKAKELLLFFKDYAKKNLISLKDILMPLRILITNTTNFPNFFDIIEFWSKERSKEILLSRYLKIK